jgi:hypothetical protein
MPSVTRFVALVPLLAGCALASEPRVARDASEGDAPAADSTDAPPVDAAPDAAPDACVAVAEVCNGADDDCDGDVDNGLALGVACDGDDTDACIEGMTVCGTAGDVICSDVTSSTVEVCNNMDDDCRNGADDTFDVGTPCTTGLGACERTGTRVCNAQGNGTTCNAVAGPTSAELCGNNIDEDCNGADAACPANDYASGAIDISAGGTFTADLTAAHDDNWAASTQFDCGNQGGRDVFYQFTLPAEEVVYWDTFGSSFDSVVRVFAGACSGIGATYSCTDDACSTTRSQGAINLQAGTYCLVVDQFSSNVTAGAASLVFRRGGRSGIGIVAASGTQTGTTAGRTNQSTASCESNTNQPDVGYFFLSCPSRTYTVSANTCTGTAFDTVLYIRSGRATTADVACSDDVSGCGSSGFQSRITGATVSGANLQWLIVDGFGTSGNGSYTLTYTVQ